MLAANAIKKARARHQLEISEYSSFNGFAVKRLNLEKFAFFQSKMQGNRANQDKTTLKK